MQASMRPQGKGKQFNYTQKNSFFPRKNKELPWVGFEPTTLCSLGTHCATRAAQQAGAQIYNTMQLS